MSQFQYKGASIHYRATGKGVPVVLIHGFGEDQTIWEDFIPMLPTDFQYITFDLPGAGRSDVMVKCSIAEMAEILKRLLEHLAVEKAIVIGHSMGGYVSLAFAEKYPNALHGLGLFHSHPYADSEEKKSARDKQSTFIERTGSIYYVKELIPKLFPKEFLRFNPLVIDKLIHRAAQFPPAGLRNALHAMRDRTDQTKTLQQLQVPVLFIIGKKDTLMAPEQAINQTVLPTISFIKIFQEIGHVGMFEAPRKTSKAVRAFLNYCK